MSSMLLHRRGVLLRSHGVGRRHVALRAAAPVFTKAPIEAQTTNEAHPLFFKAVVFDMDGTLTEAHIDFADMRARTGIPVGDLFTVMESWEDDERIAASMATILDIEAHAARAVSTKPGLMELLQLLRDHQVPVALVTRNTPESVDAFFRLIGPVWAGLFSQVLTRHFPFVKPDKRLLLHVAQAWGINPSEMLMVGDSLEDVECGNASGAATCLVAGGGNEKPGTMVQPPPGAVATFSVSGLGELAQKLALAGQQGPQAAGLALGWPARLAAGEVIGAEGAPAPGLDYLDWLAESGALRSAPCSFPRMGRAAGGLASCEIAEWGDRVLHVFCGAGGLTKLLASQGLQVWGVDVDVEVPRKRGLRTAVLSAEALGPHSLDGVLDIAPVGGFDCVLLDGANMSPTQQGVWWKPAAVAALLPAVASGGRVCAQVPLIENVNPAAVLASLQDGGLQVLHWRVAKPQPGCFGLIACSEQLEIVAMRGQKR